MYGREWCAEGGPLWSPMGLSPNLFGSAEGAALCRGRPVKKDGKRTETPTREKVPSGEVEWERSFTTIPLLLNCQEEAGMQNYNSPGNTLEAATEKDYHQVLVYHQCHL
jgi:hypothetical protein